jgi:RNA polymerase sigma factor (sigma-70 family)
LLPNGESRHPVLQYLRRVRVASAAAGISDSELLRRFAASRDETAFELLVWRHGSMVLRVCRGILRDAAAAEDAFQGAFLTLACKAASVARYPAPAGWLYRVACHVARKALTSKTRREARETSRSSGPAMLAADVVAETAELAAILHEEVNRLAARYRTPIVLCYLEGKTHEEAARVLGWPKGTVAGRLARARDLLKRRLIRRGVTFPAAGLTALLGATAADAALTATLTATTASAAAGFVAGSVSAVTTSAAASHLAKGVIHTMFVAKMKAVALVCLTAGLVIAGAGVLAGGGGAPAEPAVAAAPPDKRASETSPSATERPAVDDQTLAARQRLESVRNLRQLCLAMHNYHDIARHFAGNVTDKQGQTLLSWRVALLPVLDEMALYKEFNLAESWDSPHNKKLLTRMPKIFRLPIQGAPATDTFYQGFAGPGTMFDPAGPVSISEVTDGPANTIFIVEAAAAVPWTKPEDRTYDPAKPLPKLGAFSRVFPAAFVDGSIHTLRKDFKESALRATISRNGGETIDWDALLEDRLHRGSGRGNGVRELERNTDEHVRLIQELIGKEREAKAIRQSQAIREELAAQSREVDQLKADNARLLEALQKTLAATGEAQIELGRLLERATPTKEAEEQAAARLKAHNAALEVAVMQQRVELQEIRDQIERLKKNLEK